MGIIDMTAPMNLGGQHGPHSHWSRSTKGCILLKALKLHVVTEKWNDSQHTPHKAIIIYDVLHRNLHHIEGSAQWRQRNVPPKGSLLSFPENDRDELDNENLNF